MTIGPCSQKPKQPVRIAPDTGQHVPDSKHMKFYKPQLRIALRNCGFIDPENIGEYIARDGYAALAKVLPRVRSDSPVRSSARRRAAMISSLRDARHPVPPHTRM